MSYQKTLKITNKAILKTNQMNATNVLINDYDKRTLGIARKTNPFQTHFVIIHVSKG